MLMAADSAEIVWGGKNWQLCIIMLEKWALLGLGGGDV
jgi:hypothetical protein